MRDLMPSEEMGIVGEIYCTTNGIFCSNNWDDLHPLHEKYKRLSTECNEEVYLSESLEEGSTLSKFVIF